MSTTITQTTFKINVEMQRFLAHYIHDQKDDKTFFVVIIFRLFHLIMRFFRIFFPTA